MTYWEKYISEAKYNKKTEKKELSIKKRKAAQKVLDDLAKKKDKNKEKESEYTKYLKQQLEFKKQKYEDQKKRQLEKSKDAGQKDKAKAKEAISKINLQRISYKDKDLTAHSKAIENLGSSVFGLAKAAHHGLESRRKRKEAERKALESQNEKKEPGRPGRPKKKSEEGKKTEVKGQLTGTPERKALPPGRPVSKRKRLPASSEGESRVGQPAAGSRPQLPGSMKKRMLPSSSEGEKRTGQPAKRIGQPTPERPQLPRGLDKRKMLPPSSEGGRRTAGPAQGSRTEPTMGQKARQNPELRAKMIKARMEEYSNWREEFLFEVEDKKNKSEKKKVIDIMSGTNKIEMNPRIMEDHKEIESGEKKDDEGYMVNVELDQMERAVKALRKKIKKADMQIPAWVQSKITRAADYIDTASEYMQSDEKLSEEVDKKKLLMLLVLKALDNAKRRKNSQLINGIIGEAVDKSKMKCNKPKAQAHGSGESGKSHIVKACEGGKEKIIRFGQLGVKGSPKKEGESESYASRRHRFQTRHAKNIAKGKMSAAYWANKVKW